MAIIILQKNLEYLGTDIFSRQMGGRKQHDGLWQFFQDLICNPILLYYNDIF